MYFIPNQTMAGPFCHVSLSILHKEAWPCQSYDEMAPNKMIMPRSNLERSYYLVF